MKSKYLFLLGAPLCSLFTVVNPAFAQGTAFTYTGRLNNNGAPVSGSYDTRFTIYDSDVGANVVAGPLPVNAVAVANGLFTVRVDFGAGVFTGPARWLEVSVRPVGAGNFTVLAPRLELTSSPYAIRAASAGTAADVSAGSVVKSLNTLKDAVTLAAGANVTITPNGNTLTLASAGAGGNGIWSVNNNDAYYIAGNVGIGTNSPTPGIRLEVNGVTRLAPGGNGGYVQVGTPNGETGLGVIGANRFDLRFDGSTLKLAAGPGLGPPAPQYGITINTNGNVGIGMASPLVASQWKLEVNGPTRMTAGGSGGAVQFSAPNGESGMGVIGVNRADFRFDGSTLKLVAGLGLGPPPAEYGVAITTAGNVGIGTASPLAKLDVRGTTRTCVLTITGGCDVAEPFLMNAGAVPQGSVVVIDDEHPGKLKLSDRAYDTRVAGIVSGANGISPGISLQQEGAFTGGQNVALSGRVYVQATAAFGAIKPGDLLTTSETPGHAMKVSDPARAQGTILGKAMSALKEGKGMVLVLVTLQ